MILSRETHVVTFSSFYLFWEKDKKKKKKRERDGVISSCFWRLFMDQL